MAEDINNIQDSMEDDPKNSGSYIREGTTNIENFMPITGNPPTVDLSTPVPQSNRSATLPYNQLRDNVTGFPPYSSNQIPKEENWLQNAADYIGQTAYHQTDQGSYSKPYMYDASAQGTQRARYKAYGQETFDKVGFNPTLNNEDIFNANTTIVDDFIRMGTKAFLPMYGNGLLAGPKSYGDAIGLDFGQDTEQADSYEEYNNIGYSSKGGVGGFVNNLFNSVAYSAGVLTEAAAEYALIGMVEGAVAGPQGAAGGAAAGGLFGILKSIPQMGKALYQMTKYGGKMSAQLKNLRKYSEARKLWATASRTTADFINPLGQTGRAFQRNILSNADNLSNLARGTRTAAGFFRDVSMLNAGLSEGRLEGGFVENNTYRNGYDRFWKEHGRAPNADEQLDLRKVAKLAGFQATWKNALLVNYTNKLAFPNLFRGSFMKGASANIRKVGNEFNLVYEAAKKGAAMGQYKLIDYNLRNALKGFIKPKNFGKASLNYFKLNVVEGAQEVLQDVIATSTENYYLDSYFDPSKKSFDHSMATLKDAFGDMYGERGFETFASGFFMGGLLRPFGGAVPRFRDKLISKVLKNEAVYEQDIAERKADGTRMVNALNNMNKNAAEFLNHRLFNYGNQAIISKNSNSNETDTKQHKDNVTASLVSDVITTLNSGTFDVWTDNLKQLKQLDAKGLEDALDLEAGQGEKARIALDNFLKRAEKIAKNWKFGQENLGTQRVSLTGLKEGTPEYDQAAIQNKAIDAAIFNLTFLQESFNDNLERVNELYQKFNNLGMFQKLPGAQFQQIADQRLLAQEIEMLTKAVEVNQQAYDASPSSEMSNQITEQRNLLDALISFQKAQQEYEGIRKAMEILKEAKKEGGLEDQDASIQALDEILTEYENNYDPNLNYKLAFENLLKQLVNNDVEFQKLMDTIGSEQFDNLYAALIDIHKLNYEAENLIPYINLLLNPAGFGEHVKRNFDWMRHLWLTRDDYYKDIINKSVELQEYNDLLFSLSQDNIYIDLEEFAKWVEDKSYQPEEFIDSTAGSERIIPKGSLLYDKYYSQLKVVADMQKVKPAGETSDTREQRDKAIEDLAKQKEDELTELRKTYENDIKSETGKDLSQLEALQVKPIVDQDKNKKSIKLKKERVRLLKSQLQEIEDIFKAADAEALETYFKDKMIRKEYDISTEDYMNTYAEATANLIQETPELNKKFFDFVNASEFTDTEFVQGAAIGGIFLQDIINSEITELEEALEDQESRTDAAEAEVNEIEQTQSYKDYQKALAEIESKYTNLIDEVNNSFRKRGAVIEEVESEVKVTDDWNSLPEDLKSQLQKSWEKDLNDPTLEELYPEEYVRRRQAWFAEQFEVVQAYNDRKNIERIKAEREAVTIREPKLKFKTYKDVSKKTLREIRAIRDSLETNLETKAKKVKGKVTPLDKKDIANIKNDIRELDLLIDKKRTSLEEISDFTESINIFKEKILDKEGEIEVARDENGNVIERRIDGRPTERVTKLAEKIQQDIYEKDPFVYKYIDEREGKVSPVLENFDEILADDSITDKVTTFITFFKSLNLPEFKNLNKVKELEDRLKNNFSRENVYNSIAELAYVESSEAGTSIDELLKDFLTREGTGFKQITRPDNISEEAFDQLFGKRGILTEFRDGMIDGEFTIVGTGNLVFDKETLRNGIVGETDLIAVNSDGEFMIVDLKAAGINTWRNFNKKEDLEAAEAKLTEEGKTEELEKLKRDALRSKKDYFRLQQSLYRNLFYNMSGIMPKRIGLLPIEIKIDRKTGQVVSAKRPSILSKGFDTVELPYNDIVENYVPLREPSVKPESSVETVEALPEDEFLFIDEYAKSNKIKDNLNKNVIYNGKVGKLVLTPDGTYGVEFTETTGGAKIIIDVLDGVMPTSNGEITFRSVALDKIQATDNISQQALIEGEPINAKFTNDLNTEAEINGVSYKVNRNKEGLIVSLTYESNAKAINKLNAEIDSVRDDIFILRNKSRVSPELLVDSISQLNTKVADLNSQVTALKRTNATRTARGGNASSLIFALNRLPGNFKTDTKHKTSIHEQRDLDTISRLASVSEEISNTMTGILAKQYPAVLDQLIEKGPSGIKESDYLKIQLWAEDAVAALEELMSTVVNKGDLATDIEQQIYAVKELQNDLELIKLTKDGKISRQQKEARKVFGPKGRLQTGSSVSQVQESKSGPSEGVSGSDEQSGGAKRKPTDGEVKSLVKEIYTKKGEIDILAGEKVEDPVDRLIKKINDATKDTIEDVFYKASIESGQNAKVTEAYNQKLQALQTEINQKDLSIGDHLVSKNPIFDSKGDVTVRVTNVFKNGNVNIVDINNSDNKMKVNMEELKNDFERPAKAALETSDVDITDEDQGSSEISDENLNEYLKGAEGIITDIDNMSSEELEARAAEGRELLRKRKCDN
tara:strand:- start:3484 stop:10719 length:7236 start_codon:yes stop_codon:yes gene_type:complete